jgi:alkylhydroperoxidase family enzyme
VWQWPDFGPRYNLVMDRIAKLEKGQVDQETGKIFDLYLQERGNVPNMFRTVAHRPEILRTMIAHFRAVMNTGTVPAKLKELVIVRTSQLNHCEY